MLLGGPGGGSDDNTVALHIRDASGISDAAGLSEMSVHAFERSFTDQRELGLVFCPPAKTEAEQETTPEGIAQLLKGKKRVCLLSGM